MASKSFNKFAFFEQHGILGWSIMLFTDWLIQRLLQISVFMNPEREVCSWTNWQTHYISWYILSNNCI